MAKGLKLTGTSGTETLSGGVNDDNITSLLGIHTIMAGAGDDKITVGNTSNNHIDAGAGNDSITVGNGSNRIFGGAGNDRITVGNGNNTIAGGDGVDDIKAGKGNNVIDAGTGNDIVRAGDGNNLIYGGDGNDSVGTGKGNDSLDGGAGNDILAGGAGNDSLEGGAGNDRLLGDGSLGSGGGSGGGSGSGSGGGSGGGSHGAAQTFNDYLNGGAGNDVVYGERGNDQAIYTASENLGARDVYDGGSGIDTLTLELTRAEWLNPQVQLDIAAYLQFLRGHTSPVTGQADGAAFQFNAFNLQASRFENLRVFVDGQELDPRDAAVDAVNDTASINEDSANTFFGSVLANDMAPDLAQSVRLVTPPAAGVLAFNTGADGNPDGTYSFNPAGAFEWLAEGESTTVSFTYEVKDADGDTDQATVTIEVTGTNDAAVISGDVTGAVVEAGGENNGGTPVATGTLTASDVDNAPDSFQAVATATAGDNGYGSYTMAADGSWTYTLDNANAAVEALDAGDTLTDSFTVYTIDGTAQQVAVTINGAADVTVNQAPVAVDDVVDSVVGSGDAAIITFEAYYIEYNVFTEFYRLTTGEGFLFTDNGAGSYQQGNTVGGPNVSAGDWGVDYSNALYSYGVEFNAYDTSTSTLPIVMTRLDGEDFSLTSANITSYNLGGNSDAAFHATVTGYLDGQQVAQQSFDVPDANFAEIVNNMVALTDPGFSAVDRVEYSLTAENNGYIESYYDSNTDTFVTEQYQFAYQWIDNIHTGAAISRPTEGRVLRGIDVLANDTDDGPQGDLSIAQFSATSALGAALTLNPDGTLNYDPTAVATINALGAGQSLVDTFTYVAQDAFGALSNTATVTLGVQGVNDTPVAHDDELSPVQSLTNEDTSVQIASATLLANDTDVDNGHVLHVGSVAATSALGAAVSIDGNGVITYDPTVSSILGALGENEFANDSFI